MALNARETITDSRLLVGSGSCWRWSSSASSPTPVTHSNRRSSRSSARAPLILVSRVPHPIYLEEVEWETLLFFAGLFIMVGALVDDGRDRRPRRLPRRADRRRLRARRHRAMLVGLRGAVRR